MLVLSRRPGEKIMIGDNIVITVSEVDGDKVKLGIQAPRNVAVDREEIRSRKDRERKGNVRLEDGMNEERSAGMYEVSDPAYPQVKVGKYTICRQDDKSIWIQTDNGEGGQFSDEKFFAAVDAFYRENF
jgi:carbon storage regulator